ncbi:MAG: hypothetical protein ACRCSP_07355 [Rhodoglobus sp.]
MNSSMTSVPPHILRQLMPTEVGVFTQLRAQGETEQEALGAIVATRDATTARDAAATYAAGAPMLHPATGALPYGLGFLGCIPIIGLLVAGIVMVAVYPSQRRRGGVAVFNARCAANWGLTVLAGIVLAIVLSVIGAFMALVFSSTETIIPTAPIPVLFILFSRLLIIALFVTHIVVLIMGLVKCSRGEFFNNRLAIPFIR